MRHEFVKRKRVFTGECGDHYCPGHYDKVLTCSCGWKIQVDNNEDEKELLLQHRLDLLEGPK